MFCDQKFALPYGQVIESCLVLISTVGKAPSSNSVREKSDSYALQGPSCLQLKITHTPK